jgi:hypothetical protein
MIVIAQETVSVDQPRISLNYHAEDFQELLVIGVGLKDHLESVSPGDDVVQGAFEFQTKRSCHKLWIASRKAKSKT